MGCLRLFQDKCKSKKRPEAPARTPTSPLPVAAFSSTVSTEACSSVFVPPAAASYASSANATSSSKAASGARPAASKSWGSGSSARSIPELYKGRGAHSLQEFGLRELRGATSDFSPLLMVYEGVFGCVYRGVLRLPSGPPDGTAVAVKRLNPNGRQCFFFLASSLLPLVLPPGGLVPTGAGAHGASYGRTRLCSLVAAASTRLPLSSPPLPSVRPGPAAAPSAPPGDVSARSQPRLLHGGPPVRSSPRLGSLLAYAAAPVPGAAPPPPPLPVPPAPTPSLPLGVATQESWCWARW